MVAAASATLGFISADAVVPDPTDVAWPKWLGYAVVGTTAAIILHYAEGNESYPGPWSYTIPDPTSVPPPYNKPNKFPDNLSGWAKGIAIGLTTLDVMRKLGNVNPELNPSKYSLRPFKSTIDNFTNKTNSIYNEVKFKTSQGIYDTNHWAPGGK